MIANGFTKRRESEGVASIREAMMEAGSSLLVLASASRRGECLDIAKEKDAKTDTAAAPSRHLAHAEENSCIVLFVAKDGGYPMGRWPLLVVQLSGLFRFIGAGQLSLLD
jgi:hypothetical protein